MGAAGNISTGKKPSADEAAKMRQLQEAFEKSRGLGAGPRPGIAPTFPTRPPVGVGPTSPTRPPIRLAGGVKGPGGF